MLAYVERNLAPRNAVGADTWIAYALGLDAAFDTHKAKVGLGEKGGDQQGGCTSHMSALDSEGNMVALTYTQLHRFGSAVVMPQTSMLRTNSVDHFYQPPGHPGSPNTTGRRVEI